MLLLYLDIFTLLVLFCSELEASLQLHPDGKSILFAECNMARICRSVISSISTSLIFLFRANDNIFDIIQGFEGKLTAVIGRLTLSFF